MKKQPKKNLNETPKEQTDVDFSFQDIENEVDKILGTSKDEERKKPTVHHISEKIQMGMEIKNKLPDKGFLEVKAERGKVKFRDRYGEEFEQDKVIVTSKDVKDVEYVEITDGIFKIDLRNDAGFWFIRSPVVVPSMITQAIRTHLDIKKCHEPEKRKTEIPIWLIAALIGGAAIIIFMLFSIMSRGG